MVEEEGEGKGRRRERRREETRQRQGGEVRKRKESGRGERRGHWRSPGKGSGDKEICKSTSGVGGRTDEESPCRAEDP